MGYGGPPQRDGDSNRNSSPVSFGDFLVHMGLVSILLAVAFWSNFFSMDSEVQRILWGLICFVIGIGLLLIRIAKKNKKESK